MKNKTILLIAIKVRFFIFNIRLLKKYKTSTGTYFLPYFAYYDVIRKDIIDNKIFDQEIFEIGKSFIHSNSIVIDAGANFGQMSILFSKANKDVEVYAFEAQKFVYRILTKNIKINNAKVKCYYNLLGSEKKNKVYIEKSKLSNFTPYGSISSCGTINIKKVEQSNNSDAIETLRIDDLKIEKKISFFKIDVQGMDFEVLKGAEETIMKHRMPIIFEYEKNFENEYNYKFEDYEKFIKKINYKISKIVIKNNYLILPN